MSDLAKLLEYCGEESTVESVDIPHAVQVSRRMIISPLCISLNMSARL